MDLELQHIGIMVKDIEKARQNYINLGYKIKSQVVHDPVQTAYAQFLELTKGQPLVELVSPDGPESKLFNALKKGGGLNHLCYKTANIEASCDELRSSRMFLLQAPVKAVAFKGRQIAWLMGKDGIPIELVEA